MFAFVTVFVLATFIGLQGIYRTVAQHTAAIREPNKAVDFTPMMCLVFVSVMLYFVDFVWLKP